MSAVTMEKTEVRLQIEGEALRFMQVKREQNEIRIVFQRRRDAEKVETTLITASELQRPAVLPPFRKIPPNR